MEIVWDKGSSGLVFYTDGNYWADLEGKGGTVLLAMTNGVVAKQRYGAYITHIIDVCSSTDKFD